MVGAAARSAVAVSDRMAGRLAVRDGVGVKMAEQSPSWTSDASVAAVEVEGMLYDGAGVSSTAVAKEPGGNRNAVGDAGRGTAAG